MVFDPSQRRVRVGVAVLVLGEAVVDGVEKLVDAGIEVAHEWPIVGRWGKPLGHVAYRRARHEAVRLIAGRGRNRPMELGYRDRALLVDDTLVLADCHLGKGEANVEFPIGDTTDVLDRFDALLADVSPARVVVAGDLLHSFSTIPLSVREAVDGLRDAANEHGAEMIVAPGNHDVMLDAVWDGPTREEVRVGDTVVLHGHEPPETDAERYVVGHDHPTIVIEGRRRACYLVGENCYRGSDVVVLPAFNRLLAGVVVNEMRAGEFMSPLITDADAFSPVVVDEEGDETLAFPDLGALREHL